MLQKQDALFYVLTSPNKSLAFTTQVSVTYYCFTHMMIILVSTKYASKQDTQPHHQICLPHLISYYHLQRRHLSFNTILIEA